MGYTHYWRHSKALTDSALRDISAIVVDGKAILRGGDGSGEPEITPALVSFNGDGEESHETFFYEGGAAFSFCKTARKDYDGHVCACLLVIHEAGLADVSSDGDKEDWREGSDIFRQVLGREPPSLDFLADAS